MTESLAELKTTQEEQSDLVRRYVDEYAALALEADRIKQRMDWLKGQFETLATGALKDTKLLSISYWGSQNSRVTVTNTATVKPISLTMVFQSTRPARGATAKVNKFLCTFLQKRHGFQIFLRKTLPFKAFCRLQIGKNFSICGANRCGNFCELLLRTIRSSVLPEGRSACSQNAQFYSHTFSRDNRNADCLFPDP